MMKYKKYWRWLVFVLTTFVSALSFNTFYRPLNIVAGGSTGLAILVNGFFPKVDISLFILIFSIAVLIIASFFLEKEKIISALVAAFLLPLFIKLTANIPTAFELGITDPLVICLIAGFISGILSGIDGRCNLNSGGVILLSETIHYKTYISTLTINSIINGIIVLFGVKFGIMNLIYAFIILAISKIVYDRVFLGISSNKAFYIITDEDESVEKFLKDEGYGATFIKAKGGYLKKDDQIIMTVIPTNKYNYVRDKIEAIDKNAFLVITDSYHVSGGF